MNLGFQFFFTGVAKLALESTKSRFGVMTHTTILPGKYFLHGNATGTRLHFKAQCFMTGTTTVFHAMYPVGKNDRIHVSRFGGIVEYHVAVLSVSTTAAGQE